MKRSPGTLSRAVVCALITFLGAATSVARAAADQPEVRPFTGLVVFGDSLSDSGNAGRFTNGPVWVEVLARDLGLDLQPSRSGGSNYAVGGARSHGEASDIRGQLRLYLDGAGGHKADPDSLYVVWGGANDLLAAGCAPGRGAAATAAAAIRATVDDLAAAGARQILVADLPDLGRAPIVEAQGRACAETARRLSETFNGALARGLREVEAARRIRIVRLDVFALAETALAGRGSLGSRGPEASCPSPGCDGWLFSDSLHPSAAAHRIIADAALRALGLPARTPAAP